MHFKGQSEVKQEEGLVKKGIGGRGWALPWYQGGGPWVKKNAHTNRFSNRHIPQIIDLELLYQLILRCWKFHCGKEKRDQSWWQTLLTLSPHHQGISWICTQPRPYLPPFPISL